MWEVESKPMENPEVNNFTLGGIHPSEEGFQIGIAPVEEERAKVGKADLGHSLGMRQLSLNVVSWDRVGKADGKCDGSTRLSFSRKAQPYLIRITHPLFQVNRRWRHVLRPPLSSMLLSFSRQSMPKTSAAKSQTGTWRDGLSRECGLTEAGSAFSR